MARITGCIADEKGHHCRLQHNRHIDGGEKAQESSQEQHHKGVRHSPMAEKGCNNFRQQRQFM